MSTIICIAEDRLTETIAVKLLVLSIVEHCPDAKIYLVFPPATDDFKLWITKFQQVELRTTRIPGAYAWNVKPHALLSLFEEGHDEIWWIDSDVILTRDFRCNLGRLSQSTIVLCESALYGGNFWDNGQRAKNWGFEIGRSFPSVLNSGVIRVTRDHIPLLKHWKDLLESDIYKQSQQKPYDKRDCHLYGDRDVLTALLTSRDFSGIPVKLLYRGKDIIQYFGPLGYTVSERLINFLNGLPPFIHCLGFNRFRQPMLDWSTYIHCIPYMDFH